MQVLRILPCWLGVLAEKLSGLCLLQAGKHLQDMDARGLGMLMSGFSHMDLRQPPRAFVEACSQRIEQTLADFTATTLGNCTWSLNVMTDDGLDGWRYAPTIEQVCRPLHADHADATACWVYADATAQDHNICAAALLLHSCRCTLCIACTLHYRALDAACDLLKERCMASCCY